MFGQIQTVWCSWAEGFLAVCCTGPQAWAQGHSGRCLRSPRIPAFKHTEETVDLKERSQLAKALT